MRFGEVVALFLQAGLSIALSPLQHRQSPMCTIAGTLSGMSSRVTSEFGSLGERIASTTGDNTPATPARHVVARDDAGSWQPALLTAWRQQNGHWWGRVVMLDAGEPALLDLAAERLRPANCGCCQTPA
ncbi:hypothetical protein [Propioniciclava soli]|uniref:hypothetical protein n=1 Tax=Propioniciclava soli TaxID=2775081 RepID=UPI001E429473|nr:hypothetical protein [Propioniciclava soli]